MASVTKTAISSPHKTFGREWKMINVSTIPACPALDSDGNLVRWPELEEILEEIQTVASVEGLGAFTAGDTELNIIVEGMDFSAGSGAGGYADAYSSGSETWLEYLATLTGETVTEVAF